MTVPSQINRDQQAGDGISTLFTVPFRILDATHIKVLQTVAGVTTTLTLVTDYTIPIVGGNSTPVEFVVAPVAGAVLVFIRDVPVTQETDYVPNDPFPAESHERALDKLTMIAQQQAEITTRAIVLPPQTIGVSTELPGPEALHLLRWNAAEDALENALPPEIATVADGAVVDATVSPIAAIQGTKLAFLQAGVDAVLRDVQSKLRETISVKDFGAVGDGVADDTAAIQKAIDYAESLVGADHGVCVNFPEGNYKHAGLLCEASGVILDGGGRARLLYSGTTGNGLEFKAPNFLVDPNARIYRCGLRGVMLGNATANGVSGTNVYFQNVQDAVVDSVNFGQFPFKPFTALTFERCTNLTLTNIKGSNCGGTGIVLRECGGIFGNSCASNSNGGSGWEFDSVTGCYLKTIQGFGNTNYGAFIRNTITVSNISDQASFFLIESWDMDTNADHNWSITDLTVSSFTNCWGSTQTGSAINKVGFSFGGACENIDMVACKALANNGDGVFVGSTCININVIGGTFSSNGRQAGSANRNGITHQGTGAITGAVAGNIPRYGATQQYGVAIALGAASNFMRVVDCKLTGNVVAGAAPITPTNYTNFFERGNDLGASFDVASATDLQTPEFGETFNVTGTTDIVNIKPSWRGRRVKLVFASTARLVGGSALRLSSATITPAQYGTATLWNTGAEWVLESFSVNDNA